MPFPAQRVRLSHTIHLAAPPGQVFPLFEPIGEQAWAEGWEPHPLFPADGAAQAGAVFTTGHPPEGESIWTLTAYEPTRLHLAYLRVTPGLHVAFIEVQCENAQDGTTRATVTYTLTSLSAAGQAASCSVLPR
ncbi:MAG TPA: SRPBCC family protein [Ktedonobacterales bacterium]|nr:SRPBCC family protein [Ktedonobacterales bacterium]